MNYGKAAWISVCVNHTTSVDTECDMCMIGAWIDTDNNDFVVSVKGEPFGVTYWQGIAEIFKTYDLPAPEVVSHILISAPAQTDYTL